MRRIGSLIQTASVIAVITVLMFLAINWIVQPFVPPDKGFNTYRPAPAWTEKAAQKWIDHYGLDVVRRVYPGKTDEEIRRIVFNKLQVYNRYEPFLEFLPDAVYSGGVGVHEAGFRLGGKAQGPWPIDKSKLNVLVFGGSTAFGAGAPDEETISAYLQSMLRAKLGREVFSYNFGVGAYYSSQELINFWRLARDGISPDLVVFVDGLNDYFQKTEDTAHSGYYRDFEKSRVAFLKQLQSDRGPLWHIQQALVLSPLGRLASSLKTRELKPNTPGAEALTADKRTRMRNFTDEDRAHVLRVTERLLNNFKMAEGMATSIGAESAFVVQPTPVYEFDLTNHPFPVPEWHQYTRIGYPVLKERLDSGAANKNVIWCANIQRDAPKDVPLYVDPVHYTSAMDKMIAACIVDGLARMKALDRLAQKRKASDIVRAGP